MLPREDNTIICVFYIFGWYVVTISGQGNGQLHKAVLCKNGSDYFTISCGQPSSHFPAFINIETVPRLIYSERLKYMNGTANCPSRESEIVVTCQSETTTPISRCHTNRECQLQESDITKDISFRNCPGFSEGIFTANIVIIEYSCFQVSLPRDIAFETNYLERRNIPPDFRMNMFNPRFPANVSAVSQSCSCNFTRAITGEVLHQPASVVFTVNYLVGNASCDQRLSFSSDWPLQQQYEFCSTQIQAIDFNPHHRTIRFQKQMTLHYMQPNAVLGGKMWLRIKSNASLNIQCTHRVNSIETSTTIPTFSTEGPSAYSTTQSSRNTTDVIQQQNNSEDVKLYYIIGGGFAVLFLMILVLSVLAVKRRRKSEQQHLQQNRHYNIYSETPPNRKLVKSEIFNTQLTDGNANVIPSQSKINYHNDERTSRKGKTATNKAPKNAYDRIKLGKIRWRLPGRKDSTYADINRFQHKSAKDPTPDSRGSRLKRQSSHNYENPDISTLQSYENIPIESLSRELTTKPSVTVDETVMVENTGVYESVDSNV